MANLDFKTKEGQAKATELAKEIFHDFENVETTFTETNTMYVTVNDAFEFRFFDEDSFLQMKRIITLLELKKLDKLANGNYAGVNK